MSDQPNPFESPPAISEKLPVRRGPRVLWWIAALVVASVFIISCDLIVINIKG